jgi:two-component system, sensor histidine kinase and response regulator
MSNIQVLIIEDAAEIRGNIAEILRLDGFTVLEAGDGEAGLALVRSNPPNLILCDIIMPIVDGYDVLKQIRSEPQTAWIPFVFLTGKDSRSEQRQGMCLGADDYLAKPFRRHELLDILHSQLAKQAQRDQWCRQTCNAQQISQQQALEAQLNVLQLREQETQAWVGGITHDLRAPLTTIKVALELLQRAPEQADRYFTIAHQACSQSDALIEELLAFYREEEAVFSPPVLPEKTKPGTIGTPMGSPPVGTSLRTLFYRLKAGFQARTEHLELPLKWSEQPEFEYSDLAETDLPSALTVERIITELLNNACKYTSPGGTIEFTAHLTPPVVDQSLSNQTLDGLQVFIRNEGEIHPKALPYIFDKFYRGTEDYLNLESNQPSGSGIIPGTGLGLSLVRQLTEQLGGTLEVESQSGWTTFILWIPLSRHNPIFTTLR